MHPSAVGATVLMQRRAEDSRRRQEEASRKERLCDASAPMCPSASDRLETQKSKKFAALQCDSASCGGRRRTSSIGVEGRSSFGSRLEVKYPKS